jgi:hypothetical protein
MCNLHQALKLMPKGDAATSATLSAQLLLAEELVDNGEVCRRLDGTVGQEPAFQSSL